MKNHSRKQGTIKLKIHSLYDKVDTILDQLLQWNVTKRLNKVVDRGNIFFNGFRHSFFYLFLVLYSIFFTVVSQNVILFQSQSYDYAFHLSRIVGLAESISHWDLLPNLNFLFSYGTGYASPMFYGNWQFYPSAIVYVISQDANLSYLLFAFLIVVCTCLSSYIVIAKIMYNKLVALTVALTLPCYYTLFGFGMTMVLPLVPILFYAIYRVVFLNKKNPLYLGVVVALLVQTHILSTIILAIASFIFLLLNYKKITIEKLASFVFSIVFALFLSAGYIFQYLEQVSSQKFLFSWMGRSFPVNVKDTFSVPYPFQVDRSGFYKPFTPLEWPIHQMIRTGLIVFTFLVLIFYRRISKLSKSSFFVCWLLYFMATSLLPWRSLLKYSFMGSIQYSGRLLFFIPLFFIFFLAFVNKNGILSFILCCLSLSFFYNNLVPNYHTSSKYYKQMRVVNRKDNKLLKSTYKGKKSNFVNPVGDEYYNLEVDNQRVRDPHFSEFQLGKGLSVSNVNTQYNLLEFDVESDSSKGNTSMVVPLIWYKGYTVNYSEGASGTEASMAHRSYKQEELNKNQNLRKPKLADKILNDGKIYLKIKSSGHVAISYHKTFLQYLGYIIESLAWFVVAYIFKVVYEKKKNKSIKTS